MNGKGKKRVTPAKPQATTPGTLVDVHARLYPEDIEALKRWALEAGHSWQVELRVMVRRGVRERSISIIAEE